MTSGSVFSLSVVNPQRSAKRTVSIRRSAPSSTDAGATAFGIAASRAGARVAEPPIGVPHFGQNAKSGWQASPQATQEIGCRAPHFGQNAKPLSIAKPQAAQSIGMAPTARV